MAQNENDKQNIRLYSLKLQNQGTFRYENNVASKNGN